MTCSRIFVHPNLRTYIHPYTTYDSTRSWQAGISEDLGCATTSQHILMYPTVYLCIMCADTSCFYSHQNVNTRDTTPVRTYDSFDVFAIVRNVRTRTSTRRNKQHKQTLKPTRTFASSSILSCLMATRQSSCKKNNCGSKKDFCTC